MRPATRRCAALNAARTAQRAIPTLHFMMMLLPEELDQKIEIALWRADATGGDFEKLCAEARENRFRAVCVPGSRIALACVLLEDSEIKVTGLIGFPFGNGDADAKRFETEAAIDCGAHEIELALNLGRLKDDDRKYVLREMRDVVEAADERPVKVVLEPALLTEDDLRLACELVLDSGAQFISAGTGLHGPVSVETVKLLRECAGPKLGLKAFADLHDGQTAINLVAAGATRLGVLVSAD